MASKLMQKDLGEAADIFVSLNSKQKVDANGKLMFDSTGKPIDDISNPELDQNGKQVYDNSGKIVYEQQVDTNGKPMVDTKGNPIYVQETYLDGTPKTDSFGNPINKPKYKLDANGNKTQRSVPDIEYNVKTNSITGEPILDVNGKKIPEIDMFGNKVLKTQPIKVFDINISKQLDTFGTLMDYITMFIDLLKVGRDLFLMLKNLNINDLSNAGININIIDVNLIKNNAIKLVNTVYNTIPQLFFNSIDDVTDVSNKVASLTTNFLNKSLNNFANSSDGLSPTEFLSDMKSQTNLSLSTIKQVKQYATTVLIKKLFVFIKLIAKINQLAIDTITSVLFPSSQNPSSDSTFDVAAVVGATMNALMVANPSVGMVWSAIMGFNSMLQFLASLDENKLDSSNFPFTMVSISELKSAFNLIGNDYNYMNKQTNLYYKFIGFILLNTSILNIFVVILTGNGYTPSSNFFDWVKKLYKEEAKKITKAFLQFGAVYQNGVIYLTHIYDEDSKKLISACEYIIDGKNIDDFTSKFISIANKNPIVKQNLTMITNFSNDTNNKSKVIIGKVTTKLTTEGNIIIGDIIENINTVNNTLNTAKNTLKKFFRI